MRESSSSPRTCSGDMYSRVPNTAPGDVTESSTLAVGTEERATPAVSVIAAWLNQRANELKIESSLLASRSDLTELINSGGGRLATGWRADTVGAPIRQLMEGNAVIRLTDGGRHIELDSRALADVGSDSLVSEQPLL